MPALARSARPLIPFGLPAATTICSLLEAKFAGWPIALPAATTFCMFGRSADAKTSAGAPLSIEVTRDALPAKLNTTDALACLA